MSCGLAREGQLSRTTPLPAATKATAPKANPPPPTSSARSSATAPSPAPNSAAASAPSNPSAGSAGLRFRFCTAGLPAAFCGRSASGPFRSTGNLSRAEPRGSCLCGFRCHPDAPACAAGSICRGVRRLLRAPGLGTAGGSPAPFILRQVTAALVAPVPSKVERSEVEGVVPQIRLKNKKRPAVSREACA